MRKFAVNIFATTGISLVLLSLTALFFQAEFICVWTVFQVLGTNTAAHTGLYFLGKSEIGNVMIEIMLHIGLVIMLLLGAGALFQWFTSTPVPVLVMMGFVIYLISAVLNLFYMKREAREINALIKKRNHEKEF